MHAYTFEQQTESPPLEPEDAQALFLYTLTEDDKALVTFATEILSDSEDTSRALQNINKKESVFFQGMKLAHMKTIMNLSTRLNLVQEEYKRRIPDASDKDIVAIGKQIQEMLEFHLKEAREDTKLPAPPLAPVNLTQINTYTSNDAANQEVLSDSDIETLVKDPRKRKAVTTVFETLMKAAMMKSNESDTES